MGAKRSLLVEGFTSLKSQGLRKTAQVASMFIGQRFLSVKPDLVQHRYVLGQTLSAQFGDTIRYGPFQGTFLSSESHWSGADRGAMLLGLYEQEILEALREKSSDRSVLINLGAADGYYAIGSLVGGLFSQAICFEMDVAGQAVIRKQAEANSVLGKVKVFGKAGRDFFTRAQESLQFNPSDCLILVDIEGAEFDVLSEDVIHSLQHCVLIIEIHAFDEKSQRSAEDLVSRLELLFEVTLVRQAARDPNIFEELQEWNDDDRWLLCSESRASVMRWAICSPRS